MQARLLRQLQAVDWDFPRRDNNVTSAIHWYPGTFTGLMPATIIEALSDMDDIVFDPYGGIGTTAAEAIRLGRKAWTVDSNPIACLSSYVISGLLILKGAGINNLENIFRDIAATILNPRAQISWVPSISQQGLDNIDRILSNMIRPKPREMARQYIDNLLPNWNDLSIWYNNDTIMEIKDALKKAKTYQLMPFTKLVAITMISAVMRTSCSETRSWGHLADNVFPKKYIKKDFYDLCQKWITRTENMVSRVSVHPINSGKGSNVRIWISDHDWRKNSLPIIKPSSRGKLLVTSPPYAGAIDYTRAQRLSLYLLGYDEQGIHALGDREIGARRKRFHSDSTEIWAEELSLALPRQIGCIDNNGTIAIVLPHKDHGREIGSSRLGMIMESEGWECKFAADRSIRQFRTRQSWTSIKRETIEVYKKY